MSVIIAEDFEAGLGAWTLNGAPTTGAAAAKTGTLGLIIDTTGAAGTRYIQKTLAGGTRVFVARFYLNVQTRPAANNTILSCQDTSGDLVLNLLTTGVLRAQVGAGTAQDSAALANATWYRIDLRFTTSGATATIDWQIDGTAQTQATRAQTAADMTTVRLGIQGSTTVKFYADTLAARDVSADYPLGPNPGSSSAGLASGTGLTHSVAVSDLAAGGGLASGTGAAYNGTPSRSTTVTAELTTGTGAAFAVVANLKPTGGLASGTGTVFGSARSSTTPVQGTSGSGSAYNTAINVTAGGTTLVLTMG